MKIFLAWSGAKSKKVVEALRDWLPLVIQSLEPWYSAEDVRQDRRWTLEIASGLEDSPVGIFCLTPDNLTDPWILFEAGAMSKPDGSSIYTFLLDLKPGDIEQPLKQFNHTVAERKDIFQLLVGINEKLGQIGERSLKDEQLQEAFDAWWPKLETKLRGARAATPAAPPRLRPEDLLGEILELVRAQNKEFSTLKQALGEIGAQQMKDEAPPASPKSHITYTLVTNLTGDYVKVAEQYAGTYLKYKDDYLTFHTARAKTEKELSDLIHELSDKPASEEDKQRVEELRSRIGNIEMFTENIEKRMAQLELA